MINFSQLLWKPQRTRTHSSSTQRSTVAEEADVTSELGNVPMEQVRISPASRLVYLTDPQSPGADRFRFLRMRLRELQALGKLKSILVTSPLPQDGKSTVAVNLAVALAEEGKRSVLLMEADLHQPTLAQSLGLERRTGLAEGLEEDVDPLSLLRHLESLGCYLLQAGRPKGNPTELLQSDSMSNMVGRLSQHFEWIVIDTPPVIPLTDTVLLSRLVDASLMVVRADRTPKEAVDQALAILGRKNVAGLILNGAEGLNKQYYGYGYYLKK